MVPTSFGSIPVVYQETARAALVAAFGSAPVVSFRPIDGGKSGALVFLLEVGNGRYVLRIEGPAGPLRSPHQYLAMQVAAQAGIAPRLHHVDDVARVAIMDFIEDVPLGDYPGGPHALARALGELFSRVQATRPFPDFISYPDIVTRLWAHVCRTGLFADGLLDPYTERLEHLRKTYVWDSAKSVSSHNDILPRNVLFDGNRLWLIDWESACRNDPLVDVATALDNFAPSPELERALLAGWSGRMPDEDTRERLVQVRAFSRLYYAGVLFSASAAAAGRAQDTDLTAPTAMEFEQAVRRGRLKPDTQETTHVLGKMFLASFFSGHAPPGLPPPLSHFRLNNRDALAGDGTGQNG